MSQNEPLISVVIPTAPGRKKDLWYCLNSILKSNYKNWEAIIVDNSEESGYEQKIKKAFPDARIKTIKMPFNSGILGSNVGLANARGDYLFLLDDDTAIKPDILTKIIAKFSKLHKNVGVVSCAVFDPITKNYVDLSKIDQNNFFCAFSGATVFRKEIFTKIGFFEHRFFCWNYEEDYIFRLLKAGYKIYFTSREEILVNHYSKERMFRQHQVFLQTRNKFWLNIKYFSWHILPLIISRDLIFIFLQPFRRQNWRALFYATAGYLTGILTCCSFLKERRPLPLSIQKKYLNTQISQDFRRLLNKIKKRNEK